jgi:UDP:flavonoid glycosyltransferase YjiC (YdhE family)
MRVLFTTQPGFGHLNPLLPYAVAVRDRGHDVRFASAPAFAEAIEHHGFVFNAIGPDFTWERAEASFPLIVDASRLGRAMDYANFEINWKRWNPEAATDLLELFEHWRPDVIVREFAENGATFAGEVAGIAVVCAAWGALPSDGRRWGAVTDWERTLDCYAAVRVTLGLAADRPGGAWERQLVLSGLPPSWLGDAHRGVRVRHFRLPLEERSAGPQPGWLDAFGRERPLLYATLGTVFNRMRRVRAAMLEALAEIDADVLMTVGRNVDPTTIGLIPANVRVERFVPQSDVLPRASLVLSHAGLGTMLGAIYAGVPMVVIAIDADQPINAQSAQEAGHAVALTIDQADASALRSATTRAIVDPVLQQAAAQLREECNAMDPIAQAATAIEEEARSP